MNSASYGWNFGLGHTPTGAVSARTLIAIRWVAVVGQATAILIVAFALSFKLSLPICFGIIAASAILNVFIQLSTSENKRLNDQWASASLGFDIVQTAALLYATGGMENPFVLLLLAPVTVSATILSLRSTVFLLLITLMVAVFLIFHHLPLPWKEQGIQLPTLYTYGTGTALIIAILFTTTYIWRVAHEARLMSDALAATQIALSREQQLSALGGLAAAAAHQLGTPLSTIAVIAAELSRDVPKDSEIFDDIKLLKGESDRCRNILASLSHSPRHVVDNPFLETPISMLIELAATPHQRNTIDVTIERYSIEVDAEEKQDANDEPIVVRSPELLHGLSTLIQNAVQFAENSVEITITWDFRIISVVIEDDGPGFPTSMLDRLGEPYLSTRSADAEHMGLGIFIGKTLLSRTDGQLSFRNRSDGGAVASVQWDRDAIER
ncbi:MAG: two-component sensor histidine kinase [Rhodospirillaceae bacterium]|nr:two-component sensor histidine kinase [Rhodospirillaceae bacterium]|tara:strand:+ start:1189 stop:2505 length:1317 start_codon:yes stop_codon:yes gene_type:complete